MKIGNIDLGYRPVLLAPLEDISDQPFRVLCKEFGAAMVYTEFISSEGMVRNAAKSLDKLVFDEKERPIGIQIFGHDAVAMRRATAVACQAKPDLIDINFGCPVRKVVNKGGGSALLRNVPAMLKITRAVVQESDLPVTVKTRLGWDESSKNIVEVAEMLQDCGIAAITIHGRTRAQLYGGRADWTLIGEVKNNPRMHIPVIGNGDVVNGEIAEAMFNRYGVDGIMIGRGAIGNPAIFREVTYYLRNGTHPPPLSFSERIHICLRHLSMAAQIKGERKAVIDMRRHYSGYLKGHPGSKAIKTQLMLATSVQEVTSLLLTLDPHLQVE